MEENKPCWRFSQDPTRQGYFCLRCGLGLNAHVEQDKTQDKTPEGGTIPEGFFVPIIFGCRRTYDYKAVVWKKS